MPQSAVSFCIFELNSPAIRRMQAPIRENPPSIAMISENFAPSVRPRRHTPTGSKIEVAVKMEAARLMLLEH